VGEQGGSSGGVFVFIPSLLERGWGGGRLSAIRQNLK